MRGQAVEAIRGYLEREGAVEMLRNRILEERTLDWLMEQGDLIAVEPSELRDVKDVDGEGDIAAQAPVAAPAEPAAPAAEHENTVVESAQHAIEAVVEKAEDIVETAGEVVSDALEAAGEKLKKTAKRVRKATKDTD